MNTCDREDQVNMAEANLFLIFNRPAIPRELYDSFKEEVRVLMDDTMTRMENAWTEFQENNDRPKHERMQAVETVFLTALLDWQDLASRAQKEIGQGNYINFQDVYDQFGILDGADISMAQLRMVERELFMLIELLRETLIHAATRIKENNDEI